MTPRRVVGGGDRVIDTGVLVTLSASLSDRRGQFVPLWGVIRPNARSYRLGQLHYVLIRILAD